MIQITKTLNNEYSTDTMQSYEGLDAVRKRQGMYIGGNDTKALMHLLWEILDNSVDEAVAGFGKKITVDILPDSLRVTDMGRGIPVDYREDGKSGIEAAFTELHTGGKFTDSNYNTSGGLNGVGATVVNALSHRVDVAVVRGKKRYTLSFKDGTAGHFGATGRFTASDKLKTSATTEHTGTSVEFYPNLNYFPQASLDASLILNRCREKAFLAAGVEFVVTDHRGDEPVTTSFLSENGLVDWVTETSPAPLLGPTISLSGTGEFTEKVVVLQEDGTAPLQDVQRKVLVDAAFSWNEKYDTTTASFVNLVSTTEGGTHVTGFERALVKAINAQAAEMKVVKTSDPKITLDDISEGLTAIILVRLPEPQFEGQTKDKLGNSQVISIVQGLTTDAFNEFCTNRKTKTAAKACLQKVVNAARLRVQSKSARDKQRARNQVSGASLPTKLKDCEVHTIKEAEIFLIEGDSAGGTAVKARDRRTQALLPLRGKILNALKTTEVSILKNPECVSFFTALGCGWKNSFDIEKLRYGKIILMTDADDDGHHIRTLILALIWVYLRPLIAAGAVFAAVPPLFEIKYRVKEKNSRGRMVEVRKSVYAYDTQGLTEQMNYLKNDLKIPASKINKPVRMKGLGEAQAEALRDTTMSKQTRKLRRITMAEAEAAAQEFERLLGKDSAPRKEFIMASYADKELLEGI